MSFCEHCEGQRFDRSRVLRALRELRAQSRQARRGEEVDEALVAALNTVRDLDIPHLDPLEPAEGEIIH